MNHLFEGLGETKGMVDVLKVQLAAVDSRVPEMEDRLDEQERDHRRWNMCLFGLAGREGDNQTKSVSEICCAVAPECEVSSLTLSTSATDLDPSNRAGLDP